MTWQRMRTAIQSAIRSLGNFFGRNNHGRIKLTDDGFVLSYRFYLRHSKIECKWSEISKIEVAITQRYFVDLVVDVLRFEDDGPWRFDEDYDGFEEFRRELSKQFPSIKPDWHIIAMKDWYKMITLYDASENTH